MSYARTPLLPPDEVARLLACETKEVYRLVDTGRLKAVRLPNNDPRVLPESLDAFLAGTGETRPSPYLNANEAAAYCGIAVQTLYNRRKEIDRVPGVRKLLFTRDALDKWMSTRPKSTSRR